MVGNHRYKAIRLEAIAKRLEAIASRLGAIVIRLEAIAIRLWTNSSAVPKPSAASSSATSISPSPSPERPSFLFLQQKYVTDKKTQQLLYFECSAPRHFNHLRDGQNSLFPVNLRMDMTSPTLNWTLSSYSALSSPHIYDHIQCWGCRL